MVLRQRAIEIADKVIHGDAIVQPRADLDRDRLALEQEPHFREVCRDLGVSATLEKPATSDVLLAAVRQLLTPGTARMSSAA